MMTRIPPAASRWSLPAVQLRCGGRYGRCDPGQRIRSGTGVSLIHTHARARARCCRGTAECITSTVPHLCPHSIRNHVDSKAGFTARPLPDRYSHCPVSRLGGVGMAGGRRGLVAPQNTFLENIVRRSNGKTSGLFYFTYEAYSFPFFKSSFPSPYRILK